MYIRINIGLILVKVSVNKHNTTYADYTGKTYYKRQDANTLYDNDSNVFTIKSQGANLIDVLEDNDVICFDKDFIVDRAFLKTMPYPKADSLRIYLNTHEIKIITHEQYMKLAQEVK